MKNAQIPSRLASRHQPGNLIQAHRSNQSGAALVITLLVLSLLTIVTVAFLGTMTWEMSASVRNYQSQKARSLAMLGMNTAVAQIRQALGPWDNPYKNFATNPPAFFWSVSPGIITQWSYTSATSITNIALFSTGSTNLVNLNAPRSDNTYPIIGGASPPPLAVYWTNVLQDPALPASEANPIVGRYAFWVDDENAKININTADGTMKYQADSLGIGSPSEVSLQVLQDDMTAMDAATNIVYLARTSGFNSPREILRATNSTADIYTNNVFNITTSSRSPDLNIFGQPKMAIIPMLGADPYTTAGDRGTDMTLDGITLQPPREIYPTASQLPTYTLYSPTVVGHVSYWNPNPTNTVATSLPWPLAFRQQEIHESVGARDPLSPPVAGQYYIDANYSWGNGMLLANYLAGTNAAGMPITWPAFSASASGGFAKKYTPRQIDSIVAQILDLGAKDISPDFPAYPGVAPARYQGTRYVVPSLVMGWLSHQVVNGLARSPKLAGLELQLNAYPAIGTPAETASYRPTALLSMWEEWWLPAAYLGGKNIVPITYDPIVLGGQDYQQVVNIADLSSYETTFPNPGSTLPKADFVSPGYWGNQLLTNNEGIDFQCNPSTYNDPDQVSAQQFHDPWARATNSTSPPYTYLGAGVQAGNGTSYQSPFTMAQLSSNTPPTGWAPGEIRGLPQGPGGQVATLPMWTNAGAANNPNLVVGGGIQQAAELLNGSTSDPDQVPLDAVRGTLPTNNTDEPQYLDGELWTDPGTPYGSATPTVRDRALQAVIPVNMNVGVPAPNSGSGNVTTLLLQPADPLVNKFPGDWVPSNPTSLAPWAIPGATQYSSYDEYTSLHGSLADPDSYWLPQVDCAQSVAASIPAQTLIPRSARFPNIGYLQYVRTGIIPDDTTNASDLLHQHGTPFRLLSFGPLSDSSDAYAQKTTLGSSQPYPDWALLDLLYVPSILYPFGGPYGYYDNVSNAWEGYGNAAVLASYSTGGGSTPGRINPNGTVIYTTNSNVPTPGIFRTLPMQAVLHGLTVDQHLNQQLYTQAATTPNPGFNGTAIDDAELAQAIATYIAANGPLRIPEEICDIPAVAASPNRPSVNTTRNDLVRQIVGNLTTQSNTFSIWVAGQSISKSKTNFNYGLYEAGDQILANVRYHFVVERYLDPGADGIYGNSNNPGVDNLVGTYDDPVDPVTHPFQPRYLYRILTSEEIR